MANSVSSRNVAWADGITVSGAEMRAAVMGAVYSSAGLIRGLRPVQIPTPAMQIRLPAGLCLIADGQNGYLPLELAAQTDLDIAAASTTQPRIDSLVAQFVDSGSGPNVFRVLTGTPAASPSAPALPPADQPTARTLRIANIAVAANATSIVNANITLQTGAVLLAGAARVPSAGSDGARPANPSAGDRIWRTDKLAYETWTGSAWVEDPIGGVGTAWTSYTPTLTAATTNPTMGTSTLVGAYTKVGRTVHFRAQITIGSGFSGGSGQWSVALPFAATSSAIQHGQAKCFHSPAGSQHWWGSGSIAAGGNTISLFAPLGTADGSMRGVSNNQPFVWASGDILHVWGTYEAGS